MCGYVSRHGGVIRERREIDGEREGERGREREIEREREIKGLRSATAM